MLGKLSKVKRARKHGFRKRQQQAKQSGGSTLKARRRKGRKRLAVKSTYQK